MEQIPILKLGPILMVSIQVDLHDTLAETLQDDILLTVQKTKARAVLIDITALDIVDSFIARVLGDTAAMVSIMDAEVVLVGMQPAVTMTLVEMGITLPKIKTAINIEAGLRQLGYELRRIYPEEEEDITSLLQEGDHEAD
jgi:rsbT antagonist protein RsbS